MPNTTASVNDSADYQLANSMHTRNQLSMIPQDEVHFHRFSHADHHTRLFWWRDHLYRAVSPGRAPLCRQMHNDGTINRLVQRGLLIDTDITDLHLSSSDLILKHRVLKFVTYPFEWPGAMLKAAARMILQLEKELLAVGLTLHDPRPWNVLFEGTKPVYVDLGSIHKLEDNPGWWGNGIFDRSLLTPLRIVSKGLGRIVRSIQRGEAEDLQSQEIEVLLGRNRTQRLLQWAKNCLSKTRGVLPNSLWHVARSGYHRTKNAIRPSPLTTKDKIAYIERLQYEVEALKVSDSTTFWSKYYDNNFLSLAPCSEWTPKHSSVHSVLANLRPATVLDLGANRGWYSQLAASLGANVIAGDLDETCVNRLYADAVQKELDIIPLILDAHFPSPGMGIGYRMLPPATERLQCDMVMALALTHHLVFSRYLLFPQIAEALTQFTKRWLLVEFVSNEDQWVNVEPGGYYSWYNLENFKNALGAHFRQITQLPSYPSSRSLLLCEK